MSTSLRKLNGKYYLRVRYGGQDILLPTECTSERDAKRRVPALIAPFEKEKTARKITNAVIEYAKAIARGELTAGEIKSALAVLERQTYAQALDSIDSIFPTGTVIAADLWQRYLNAGIELKPSTMETKRQRFGRFIAWSRDRDLRQFSAEAARQFLDSLGKISGQTRNNYISELSSVWQCNSELKNPWTKALRVAAGTTHKSAFTIDEIRTLRNYCIDKGLYFWATAITLGYHTGLRLKDVVHLLRASLIGTRLELVPEKTHRTGKRVSIELSEQALLALDEYLSRQKVLDSEYFFPEMVELYRRSRDAVSKQFRAILDGAGLYAPGRGYHSIRHTFVTEQLDAGAEITDLQAAVGHDSVKLTRGTYYHGINKTNLPTLPAL